MAGSKHGRSGGGSSGGSGEVSPLAAQLQQAWLQTQMPKAQKRSFASVTNAQNQPSRMAPAGEISTSSSTPSALSALKSLSTLFPELASVQEEKKAMISSVFENGVQPVPHTQAMHQKKTSECLERMFGEAVEDIKSLKSHAPPERSYSNSLLIQQSGGSGSDLNSTFSTSHSFSEFSHRNALPDVSVDDFSGMCSSFGSTKPSVSQAEYETAAEVEQEKTPLFTYLTDILMDEEREVEEKKCMFQEMSAYQSMAKELGDLISYDLPPVPGAQMMSNSEWNQPNPEWNQSKPEFLLEDDNRGLDSWIDEILDGPLPAELRDLKAEPDYKPTVQSPEPQAQFSHGDSGLGCTTNWTDGKDTDSEVAECQSSHAYPDSSLSYADSWNSSQAHENGSGSVPKLVVPSSNGNGVHASPVDLTNLLLRCAQAVEQSDFEHANELVNELRQHTSPYGNPSQRVAHYFMEALVARMSGTGGQLYSALSNNRPSEAQMLKAQMLFCECCPFTQVPHSFANSAILQAFKGAQRVHVIDYGILYGVQWPCLLHQLSQREGGPPHLRITGVDQPQPGFRPSARIQDTGRRLARLAKSIGVPFEFHAIADKWEAITPAHLLLREDETLAVNCLFRLRHLLDESVTAASPRNLLLSRIKSLNPKIFVQGVVNAGYNAPFFMSRFREAFDHYSAAYDMMETAFPPEHPARQTIDREVFGREILNVVACEALERVERTETYRQWQARTARAGFQQKPNSREIMARLRVAMEAYHQDFGIGEDGNWFLLGWKERITHAVTVWEPIPDSP